MTQTRVPDFTFGLSTRDDKMAYATIAAFRAMHPHLLDRTEILVIDNSDCAYYVQADTSEGTTDTDQYLYGVALRWKRQISPDPATTTFLDVPVGSTFHREIEALAASGITGGCNAGNFCPNNTVTRGQMAAFLSRALGLHWENN